MSRKVAITCSPSGVGSIRASSGLLPANVPKMRCLFFCYHRNEINARGGVVVPCLATEAVVLDRRAERRLGLRADARSS